ncbi:hypothetical protein [Amycolatopsis sp. NPDC001319]|uniref:hypothetical protein n=1 Tax=unclassified Amycolatopsis TaxID=2618356 RepID=UPI00369174D2
MGALDIGQLLASAGPSAALLVVVIVLVRLWLRAEGRANRAEKRADALAEQIDGERKRRWRAEDAAARAKRKAGEVDAS